MVVIGLDAAEPSLVEQWSGEGRLPVLRFLRSEGAWIRLESGGEISSTSVWPSIYTGTHPGKHGIYYLLQIPREKEQLELVQPEQCGFLPFWTNLDKSGKSSIIVDVPFSYPLSMTNGIQISDWGSYERYWAPRSNPPEILSEISRRFGPYPFGPEMSRDAPLSPRDFRRVRAQLLEGVALKGKVIRWLMANRPWDFFMAAFGEAHPAGHYFWKFHAADNLARHASTPGEFRSAIGDIYQAIDEQIGKIIEGLDKHTTLAIVSGHGMGPNHVGWHLLPQILSKLGLSANGAPNGPPGRVEGSPLSRLRALVPENWRRRLSRRLPEGVRDRLRTHWVNSGIDWSRDRAFSLPTDSLGFIRVNLKGREPNGLVEPGDEYDKVLSKISDPLKRLNHARSHSPVVREVFRTDEIFPGPERDRLPDLIVTWEDEKEINAAHLPELGTVQSALSDPRSGNHRPRGFAFLYGAGIQRGQLSQGHLLDIAPTILSYFGLRPPSYMDGRAWTGLLGCTTAQADRGTAGG